MSRPIALPPARLSAVFAVFVAFLVGTGVMVSVAAPTAAAAKPCWERVIDDWIDNGRIDAYFSPACLRASLRHVPEDVRAYSDFEEKVKQAVQAGLRLRYPQGLGGGTTQASRAERAQVEQLEEEERRLQQEGGGGPLSEALRYRTTDASSIPLPLIILAALALLLMTAGAAGVARRKLQARKVRAS